MAVQQGLRATCHPMPFPGIGTAAHAHISLNGSALSTMVLEKIEMSFMASVLEHLPGLCGFTMPQAVSYDRVVDDSWTGGTWVAWGTQNREVPLRRVGATKDGEGSRWEVRCLDGMANVYLALGAIVGAGLAGLRDGAEMKMGDCTSTTLPFPRYRTRWHADTCLGNPKKFSDNQKQELGITRRLPTTLQQALQALKDDADLSNALAPGLVHHYLSMKEAEQEMLDAMPEAERRVWLIERY